MAKQADGVIFANLKFNVKGEKYLILKYSTSKESML